MPTQEIELSTDPLDSRTDLDVIPGWFHPTDRALFRWFLQHQSATGIGGDLVELGAYLGKSAVVLGDHLGPGETLTVVDLFGADPGDLANEQENRRSYSTLTRDGFETNYLKFHPQLPRVHTGPSTDVVALVEAGTVRFLHVDASHLYEHVVQDAANARRLLQPTGVVVFDDYRSLHTPGVAAAVWEAVATTGMRPICVSPSKMYATWGDPAPMASALRAHLEGDGSFVWSTQAVAGVELVRCEIPTASTADLIQRQRAALSRKNDALRKARRRLRRREAELDAVRSSRSYRLGQALTAPVRRFRR